MKTKIESLGIYLPKKRLTTAELLKRCKVKPRWDFTRITGIREIRVSEGETALDMAVSAANQAFSMSQYRPEDVELIVSTSLSRFDAHHSLVYEPSKSVRLRTALGAQNAQVFDIVNACAGMFTGALVVDSFIKSGAIRCGMVISAEQGSKLHDSAYRNIKHGLDGQFASLTLGDCGAAIILDASPEERVGFHLFDFVTGAKYNDLCVGFPSRKGGGTTMITKPVKLHRAGLKNGTPYIKEALDRTGWHLSEVDYFIPHQTAERTIKKINKIIYEYFRVPPRHNQIINVQNYGNTATTAHFLALHESMMNQTLQINHKLMFLIGASGLIVGNVTYTLDDLPTRYRAHQARAVAS